jgi:hypothetical protein
MKNIIHVNKIQIWCGCILKIGTIDTLTAPSYPQGKLRQEIFEDFHINAWSLEIGKVGTGFSNAC